MTYSNVYKQIKPSIVAIASSLSPHPDFPPIIGTGFIIRETGVIVTNNHVLDAIQTLPRLKSRPGEWPAHVIVFQDYPGEGMGQMPLEIEGLGRISVNRPLGSVDYGPKTPDIGVIFVKMKGLPAAPISPTLALEEGDEILTAGFPMGTTTLRAPGWMHQFGPVVQKGIISAILPFPCDSPHQILIQIATQGGASGSPIINPLTGEVCAILFAGLPERDLIRDIATGKPLNALYDKPTALTYAIPSPLLFKACEAAETALHDPQTKKPIQRDVEHYTDFKALVAESERIIRAPRDSDPCAIPVTDDDIIQFVDR
jgi:S1-C subfamily serine protease